MSREAHTAGPWTAVHNSWETSTVYGPNDEIVASCPISYDVTEETQDELEPVKEANARLIAAAPTVTAEGQFLLDRLADFENRISTDEDAWEFYGHVTPAIARFRSAIHSATGEG